MNTGWAEKKGNKVLVTMLVVWQLLSGFCLTHPMLCDCDVEEKDLFLLCISKWLRRETIEWKFLHFFMGDTKWVRWQTLSVLHIRQRDQEPHERWRRFQQTCREWSKNCCGSWQLARCHSRNCFEWHPAMFVNVLYLAFFKGGMNYAGMVC